MYILRIKLQFTKYNYLLRPLLQSPAKLVYSLRFDIAEILAESLKQIIITIHCYR